MSEHSRLIEMQVLFSNPRLRGFVLDSCYPELKPQKENLGSDPRVPFAEFLIRQMLAKCHVCSGQIRNELLKRGVSTETFPVHYDTIILCLITWVHHMFLKQMVVEKVPILEGRISGDLPEYFSFTLAMSQVVMTDLLGAGSDDREFKRVNQLIEKKVKTAFDIAGSKFRVSEDSTTKFVAWLYNSGISFQREFIRFGLDDKAFGLKDRIKLEEKLSAEMSEADQNKILDALLLSVWNLNKESAQLYDSAKTRHEKVE